jgi:ribosomal protein S18 acetylase RimI-like enzyme
MPEATMVKLDPMTEAEFAAFLEADIRAFARENVRAGYWSETEALARSRKEHRNLLPDGLKSRFHHFYTIHDSETGAAVGVLWMKTDLNTSRASGFIYDLEIHEPYRRRGYARQAMRELEDLARGMGLRQLGLHVFEHNRGAMALYEQTGFRIASLNMLKEL